MWGEQPLHIPCLLSNGLGSAGTTLISCLLNPSPTNVIARSMWPLMEKVHCSLLPAWDKLQISLLVMSRF